MRILGLYKKLFDAAGRRIGLLSNVRFEAALLALVLLTAAAVVWRNALLDRTIRFTPHTVSGMSHVLFSDADTGGGTVARNTGPMAWTCDLRAGLAYPYCGYELFLDHRHTHGLDLSNMRAFAIELKYGGPSTSFRVYLKNYDPAYADRADDESPQYLGVETNTTPGRWQRAEFTPDDFGVAEWWMRKRRLPPRYGHPQFKDITSMIVETGSEAPLGRHDFQVREIVVRRALLSEAQWYSLLLGVWIVMIVGYLGYRVVNLRRALRERRILDALALREAQEAANHDPLTGLLNRRGMGERFDGLTAARGRTAGMAAILLDVDHFKALNDAHGHACGDRVLSDLAGVIRRHVRAVDLAARWGGEEFLVVCAGVNRRGAQRVAEKLRACIESHDFGVGAPVTASFGVHWSSAGEPDLAQRVALADKALYAAKAAGRNCCRVYPLLSRAA